MSHHRKINPRKTSSASTSSSENGLWQNNEEAVLRTPHASSSGSSTKRPIYPNVPKRTTRPSSTNEYDILQTESRIEIISSEIQTQQPDGHSSITSSTNRNAYTRHNLDLITKYTSPQKLFQSQHRPLSPIQSRVNATSNSQPTCSKKTKRTLSPFDETNQSKRTKSFDKDDDDDDDDFTFFLDRRGSKQNSSQNSNNTTVSSQGKTTTRKPTVRKLSTNQQKPTKSRTTPVEKPQIEPVETLIIEPDIDEEEENINDQISNTKHNGCTVLKDPIPIIPSPIKLPADNHTGTLNSILKQAILCTPTKSDPPTNLPLSSLLKKALENRPDPTSPCSNFGGRRFSSASSNSLVFDTPRSSLSRTTSNILLTPQPVIKKDRETQISLPTTNDMIKQLILNMHFDVSNNPNKIIYNPTELSKNLFHQYTNNRYQLNKKQSLYFGRYETEVVFPIYNDKISTIYACDICLKHFHGSLIAYQRHTAKCLSSQPPGKIVFNENDFAIFQIGETKMDLKQRIYIKSLCQIARLFIDSYKSIDDTKLNRFSYYILCRRDPILSSFQPNIYRFIGYFSKQLTQPTQQLINNLSCLFILPSYSSNQEYNQLLISFSYYLIRSNYLSTNLIYSSPARPLDKKTLSMFRIYWCDMIYAYINKQDFNSNKSITLDTLARQTFIHPRDILSSLYTNGFILPHSIDKSSVYLLKNAYHSMTSFKLYIRNKLLFMDTNNDRQNLDKNCDNSTTEVVLD